MSHLCYTKISVTLAVARPYVDNWSNKIHIKKFSHHVPFLPPFASQTSSQFSCFYRTKTQHARRDGRPNERIGQPAERDRQHSRQMMRWTARRARRQSELQNRTDGRCDRQKTRWTARCVDGDDRNSRMWHDGWQQDVTNSGKRGERWRDNT